MLSISIFNVIQWPNKFLSVSQGLLSSKVSAFQVGSNDKTGRFLQDNHSDSFGNC